MERRIANRMSSGTWSPVRSRCRCSIFSQAWIVCERSYVLATFGGDRVCQLSSRLLPAAKGSYRAASRRHFSGPAFSFCPTDSFQSFSFGPGDQEVLLFLVHLVRHSKVVLEVCNSDRYFHVPPPFSSPVSAPRAPCQRSPLPDTTKFSNSGRSSSRIDQASKSSAPPTEYVTSSRLGHEDCLVLDASPGVLQKLAATVPAVHE